MKVALNDLKALVVRGWKPLSTQVKNWMDSFWHKDEIIPATSVQGLQAFYSTLPTDTIAIIDSVKPVVIASTGNFNYETKPKQSWIEWVSVQSATAFTLRIGTSDNGQQILEDTEITSADGLLLLKPVESGQSLYFNGIPAGSKVTIKFC